VPQRAVTAPPAGVFTSEFSIRFEIEGRYAVGKAVAGGEHQHRQTLSLACEV
jgi:hypothetical protein